MLPIDDDILQSRYGDDPIAAEWYQLWRKIGAQPDEAIQATDELRQLADRLPYFAPSISQQQAIQRYVDACADVIKVLQEAQAYRAPTDQEIAAFIATTRQHFGQADTKPITPETIQALIAESQKVVKLLLQRDS